MYQAWCEILVPCELGTHNVRERLNGTPARSPIIEQVS